MHKRQKYDVRAYIAESNRERARDDNDRLLGAGNRRCFLPKECERHKEKHCDYENRLHTKANCSFARKNAATHLDAAAVWHVDARATIEDQIENWPNDGDMKEEAVEAEAKTSPPT